MGKIMAIDYGQKRMGIAISDDSKSIGFARDFIETDDYQDLLDLIKTEEVEEVILGYPLALSGGETESTQAVKNFREKLSADVSLPVWLIDERLTTQEVLTELRDMGQRLEKSKGMVDSFVAQKMLERYLQERNK